MSDYSREYLQIYDYLSAPEAPTESHPAVVFGRKDPIVAHAAGELAAANLADVLVITGGIGKDSGDILQQGFRSEAHYLGDQLSQYAHANNIRLPRVLLEEQAKHGGENAEFSLGMLHENQFSLGSLAAVAHATSARRLAATLDFKAQTKFGATPTVYRVPTNYKFDPRREIDRNEAAGELLRLADWPGQGLLFPQPDLPQNLVDFVRDKHGKTPNQPSRLASTAFGLLPSSVQARVAANIAKRRR